VLTINPANSSVTFSGNYTVVMADADIVGTDESKGQTRHWLVNSVPIDNGKGLLSLSTLRARQFTHHRQCLYVFWHGDHQLRWPRPCGGLWRSPVRARLSSYRPWLN
jgi:hypothetical protein